MASLSLLLDSGVATAAVPRRMRRKEESIFLDGSLREMGKDAEYDETCEVQGRRFEYEAYWTSLQVRGM